MSAMQSTSNAFSMGVVLLLVVTLLPAEVAAKYCWITDQEGMKQFYINGLYVLPISSTYTCNPYEYCCGAGCCESFISFYRLWYFWFCIILVLTFCSGGGYWYRRRYAQQRIVSHSPNAATVITMTTGRRHPSAPAPSTGPSSVTSASLGPGGYARTAQSSQIGYPPGPYPPYYPPQVMGSRGVLYTPHGTMYKGAPYGPPPSYDSVFAPQWDGANPTYALGPGPADTSTLPHAHDRSSQLQGHIQGSGQPQGLVRDQPQGQVRDQS